MERTPRRHRLIIGICSSLGLAMLLAGQNVQGSQTRSGAAPHSAAIAGSIVDANLTPLAGVAVTLERDGHLVAKASTAADGTFAWADVAPGDYHVHAELAGFETLARELHVASGAGSLKLPLVLMRPGERSSAAGGAKTPTPANGNAAMPSAGAGAAQTANGRATTVGGAQAGGGGGGRGGGGGGAPSSTILGLPGAPMDVMGGQRAMASPVMAQAQGWPPDPRWWMPAPGETYAAIEANSFQSAREHPLSTFGADVDTASYSNVRRFLSSGQLPPPDAVRIEELVNYFHFDYPAPRDGKPIALTTEIGDCPWAPTHRLVLIGASAAAPPTREIVGRNFVLLLDVSGSMQPPNRLPLIKTALELFVDTLHPNDTISIVTYAGTSGIALWPTPARSRDLILSTIASLSAGGSTNGGAGLVTAYRLAREAFIPGGVNRVILATDGDFNVGMVNPTDLVHLIEREEESGVFLSVFGVGENNLKDETMELLADHGNGTYAYLDSLAEARRALIREANATLETVAKDVKLQVEFNPAVLSAWKLLGYEKREMAARDFNNDWKDGGEMGAGHAVTVLYEVVPVGAAPATDRPDIDPLKYQPQPAPPTAARPVTGAGAQGDAHAGEWLTVKARYKLPDSDTSDEISDVARPGGRERYLPLAAAVAEYGLLLRDAPYDAGRWTALVRRVSAIEVPPALTADKAGFDELVATASGLSKIR